MSAIGSSNRRGEVQESFFSCACSESALRISARIRERPEHGLAGVNSDRAPDGKGGRCAEEELEEEGVLTSWAMGNCSLICLRRTLSEDALHEVMPLLGGGLCMFKRTLL